MELPVQGGPSVNVRPASVVVVPNRELVFSLLLGPADASEIRAVARMNVFNPTDETVVYKLKSNAIKSRVGATPSTGLIYPGDRADVDVTLEMSDRTDADDLKIQVVSRPECHDLDLDPKTTWKTVAKVKCVINDDVSGPPKVMTSTPNISTMFQEPPVYQPNASFMGHTIPDRRTAPNVAPTPAPANLYVNNSPSELGTRSGGAGSAYLVDVGAVAERDMNRMNEGNNTLMGLDKVQLLLLAAAGIAVIKLLLE